MFIILSLKFTILSTLWKPWSLLLQISPFFLLSPLLCHLFVNCFFEIYFLARLIYTEYSLDLSGSLDLSVVAKQDLKEKIPVLNSDQWKKRTVLIIGDSILAGFREAKISRIKRVKVRYFPGGKTEDLQYHLISYLKKMPDNIIIHISTNDSPYKTEDFIYNELVNVKELIVKFYPNRKTYHHLSFRQIRRKRITYIKIQHFETGRKMSFFATTFRHCICTQMACT